MKRQLTTIAACAVVTAAALTGSYRILHQSENIGSVSVQGYAHTTFNSTSIGFDLAVQSNGVTCCVQDAILDTGSFTTVVPSYVADVLSLPNLGEVTVWGVTGSESAYWSKMDIILHGKEFHDVPCVVLPNAPAFLLGADFFRKYHSTLDINFPKNEFSVK